MRSSRAFCMVTALAAESLAPLSLGREWKATTSGQAWHGQLSEQEVLHCLLLLDEHKAKDAGMGHDIHF